MLLSSPDRRRKPCLRALSATPFSFDEGARYASSLIGALSISFSPQSPGLRMELGMPVALLKTIVMPPALKAYEPGSSLTSTVGAPPSQSVFQDAPTRLCEPASRASAKSTWSEATVRPSLTNSKRTDAAAPPLLASNTSQGMSYTASHWGWSEPSPYSPSA